jgi:hypothetical protein
MTINRQELTGLAERRMWKNWYIQSELDLNKSRIVRGEGFNYPLPLTSVQSQAEIAFSFSEIIFHM